MGVTIITAVLVASGIVGVGGGVDVGAAVAGTVAAAVAATVTVTVAAAAATVAATVGDAAGLVVVAPTVGLAAAGLVAVAATVVGLVSATVVAEAAVVGAGVVVPGVTCAATALGAPSGHPLAPSVRIASAPSTSTLPASVFIFMRLPPVSLRSPAHPPSAPGGLSCLTDRVFAVANTLHSTLVVIEELHSHREQLRLRQWTELIQLQHQQVHWLDAVLERA